MSAEVISLGGGPITAKRRELFARAVSEAFDLYVRDYAVEPEAVVFVLNGVKLSSQISWHVTGESEDGVVSVLALAAVHMLAEAQSGRQGRE